MARSQAPEPNLHPVLAGDRDYCEPASPMGRARATVCAKYGLTDWNEARRSAMAHVYQREMLGQTLLNLEAQRAAYLEARGITEAQHRAEREAYANESLEIAYPEGFVGQLHDAPFCWQEDA